MTDFESKDALPAVKGRNTAAVPGGPGGWFESMEGEGVHGISSNANHGAVVGVNAAGGIGVHGISENNAGVYGVSTNNEGVRAETHSAGMAALSAHQKNINSEGAALYARHEGRRTAGFFEGNVVVTGDITLSQADCAEDFDIAANASAEPGTVMVLDDECKLRDCSNPYDKRVAGVVSGAGHYRPALILDRRDSSDARRSIALLGKVFCKVDADFGAIAVGDLLTTSPTAGHAMCARDPAQAFGAVIGKALRPLAGGQGLIPILIALQ